MEARWLALVALGLACSQPTSTTSTTASAPPAPPPSATTSSSAAPRQALPRAGNPPRLHAVLTVERRVFVFDDAATTRRPKNAPGAPQLKVRLGGYPDMRGGVGWLLDPEPVSSPLVFTIARSTTACVDTGKKRALFGFAEKEGAEPEWYEIVEIEKCTTNKPPSYDPRDWSSLDTVKYGNLPGAEFEWRSVAVEGDHPNARYRWEAEELSEKEAGSLKARIDEYKPGFIFRLPDFDDFVFFENDVTAKDRPDVRNVPAIWTNRLSGGSTLHVLTPNRVIAAERHSSSYGGLVLGERRFLVAAVLALDPPLRVLELTRDSVLDAGPVLGVHAQKTR